MCWATWTHPLLPMIPAQDTSIASWVSFEPSDLPSTLPLQVERSFLSEHMILTLTGWNPFPVPPCSWNKAQAPAQACAPWQPGHLSCLMSSLSPPLHLHSHTTDVPLGPEAYCSLSCLPVFACASSKAMFRLCPCKLCINEL